MSFYKFVTKAFKCFVNIFYKYKVIGAENIPDEGNVIIAANHKSNLDPIFLAAAIENRQVAAIAKKELFDIKPLAYILKKLNVIPINREKPDISTIKNILKAIKDGYVLGIFPEGTRIKEPGFGKAKAGLSLFAIKGKAQVVPISIISNYKLFNRVTIYIDKPISFEEYYKQRTDGLSFDTIVASGENTSKPHAIPTDRKIQDVDIITIDMGCKVNGYCSDMTRTFFVGEVLEYVKPVYDLVLKNQTQTADEFKDRSKYKIINKNGRK